MVALTPIESRLLASLERPSSSIQINVTNVWVIEWLSPADQKTGQELHAWLNQRRPGWAHLAIAKTSSDVLAAISRARETAERSQMRPVLHLEAHGSAGGIGSGMQGSFLTWSELYPQLAELNVATRCNLMLCAAACDGFAMIQALGHGPRAGAAALVGPGSRVYAAELLESTKEFYRRQMRPDASLRDMVEHASRELSGVDMRAESFAMLAYEAFASTLIAKLREVNLAADRLRYAQRLVDEVGLTMEEANRRIADYPLLAIPESTQQAWDELFMIDIAPENWERFGVDWLKNAEIIRKAVSA